LPVRVQTPKETKPQQRITPHDLESEEWTIGATLIGDRDIIAQAVELITADDFYFEKNRIIYRCILNLFNRNEAIDQGTVALELRRKGKLETIGGYDRLVEIYQSCPSEGNIKSYAKRVKETSLKRQLLEAANEVSDSVYNGKEHDLDTLIDEVEKRFFEIGQRRIIGDFSPVPILVDSTFQVLEEQRLRHLEDPTSLLGVPTGLQVLDEHLCGLQKTDLILVAARPGMGKTALALGASYYLAGKANVPVAFFSLEMGKQQLMQRLYALDAKVSFKELRQGSLSEAEWEKIVHSRNRLRSIPLHIDDTPGVSVQQIHAKLRRLLTEFPNLGLAVIDYLQIIKGNGESRLQEISEIGRHLKEMAKELNIPIMALCQLSRAVESRGGDRIPMLSDLRESGSLEAEADVVLFPYRKSYYKNATFKDDKGNNMHVDPNSFDDSVAQIWVGKYRNGEVGCVNLGWNLTTATFENLASQEDLIVARSYQSSRNVRNEEPDWDFDPLVHTHSE
jgi:replicative DNA helicase